MSLTFLSPSHFHTENLSTLPYATLNSLRDVQIHAYPGLPSRFSSIVSAFSAGKKGKKCDRVWIVGDYRFGNCQVDDGVEVVPRVFNVSKVFAQSVENDFKCAAETVAAVTEFLKIAGSSGKVLFWDLAVREAVHKRQKGAKNADNLSIYNGSNKFSYDAMKKQFQDQFVDIREAANGNILELIRDRGGHPNASGVSCILSACEESFGIVNDGGDDDNDDSNSTKNGTKISFLTLARFFLCKYHKVFRSLVAPIQKKLTLIRPRPKLVVKDKHSGEVLDNKIDNIPFRMHRIRLRLSHVLLAVYQLHVHACTLLSSVLEGRVSDTWRDLRSISVRRIIYGNDLQFCAVIPPVLTC